MAKVQISMNSRARKQPSTSPGAHCLLPDLQLKVHTRAEYPSRKETVYTHMDRRVPSNVFSQTNVRYGAREKRPMKATNQNKVMSVKPTLYGNYMHREENTAQKVPICTPPTW